MRYLEILDLSNNFKVDYKELMKLCPKDSHCVDVYDKQSDSYIRTPVNRKYMSYGVTPEFKHTSKSYMFTNKSDNMPELVKNLLKIAKEIDTRYNNCYINWYLSGHNSIDPHSDCINSLVPNSNILIVNFNEGDYERTFILESKSNHKGSSESIKIRLKDRRGILMDVEEQTRYRHYVAPEDTVQGRISVTFRAVKGKK